MLIFLGKTSCHASKRISCVLCITIFFILDVARSLVHSFIVRGSSQSADMKIISFCRLVICSFGFMWIMMAMASTLNVLYCFLLARRSLIFSNFNLFAVIINHFRHEDGSVSVFLKTFLFA